MRVVPDFTGFAQRIRAGLRGIDLPQVKVKVTVDDAAAKAQLGGIKAPKVTVTPDLDTTKLDGIKAQLAGINRNALRARIDFDDGPAKIKLLSTLKSLDDLNAKIANPKVKIDALDAELQLERIKASLREVDGKPATVKVKTDRSLFSTVKQVGLVIAVLGALRAGFSAMSGPGAGGFPDLSFGVGGIALKLTGFVAAGTAAAALLGPLTVLVSGLAAAGLAAALGIGLLVAAVGPQLQAAAKAGLAGLQAQLADVANKSGATALAAQGMNTTFGALHGIIAQLGPTLHSAADQVSGLADTLVALLHGPQVTGALQALPGVIQVAFSNLGNALFNIVNTIASAFTALAPAIAPATNVLGDITVRLQQLTDNGTFARWVQSVIPLVDLLSPALLAVGGAFTSLISTATTFAGGAVLTTITALGQALQHLFQSNEFAIFANSLGAALTAIQPLFATLGSELGTVFATLGTQVVNLLPIVVPVISQLADVFAQVLVSLSPLLGPIAALAGTLGTYLIPPLFALVQSLKEALLPVFPALQAAFVAAAPSIVIIAQSLAQAAPSLGLLLAAAAPLIPVLVGALVPAFQILAPLLTVVAGALTSMLGFISGHQQVFTDLAFAVGGLVIGFKAYRIAVRTVAEVQGIAAAATAIFSASADGATVSATLLANGQTVAARAAKVFTVAQGALNAVLDANPITLIVLGIVALVAGLIYAYKHSETFRNIIDAIGRALKGAFMAALDAGKAALHGIGTAFQFVRDHLDLFLVGLGLLLGPVGLVIAGVALLVRHFGQVVDFFSNLGSTIGGALSSFGDAVLHAFEALPGLALDALKGLAKALLDALVAAGKGALIGLQYAIIGGITATVAVLIVFPRLVAQALAALPGILANLATSAWNAFVSFAINAIVSIVGFVTGLPGQIAGALSTLGSTIAGIASAAWTAFVTWTITTAIQVIGFVTGLPGQIAAALSSLAGTVAGIAAAAWQAFVVWTVTTALQVMDFVTGLPGRIAGALSSLGGAIGGVAAGAWNWFVSTSVANAVGIITFVQGLPGRIAGALGDLGGLLVNAGRSIIEGLIRGIESAAGELVSAVKRNITDHLPAFVQKALGINSPSKVFAEIGKNIVAGLALGITRHGGAATGALAKLTDQLDLAGLALPGSAGTAYVMGQLASSAGAAPAGRSVTVNIDRVESGDVVPQKIVQAQDEHDKLHPAGWGSAQ